MEQGNMSLVESYAAERRARLVRLGAVRPEPRQEPKPAPKKVVAPKPISAEPFYSGMWFYHLVNYTPITPTIHEIQRACAAHFSVPLLSLVNHRQIANASLPRHVAIYLTRKLTTHSLTVMSKAFYRNQATIGYAIKKIEALIETDHELAAHVAAIRSRF
jgi:hypothetical protein